MIDSRLGTSIDGYFSIRKMQSQSVVPLIAKLVYRKALKRRIAVGQNISNKLTGPLPVEMLLNILAQPVAFDTSKY